MLARCFGCHCWGWGLGDSCLTLLRLFNARDIAYIYWGVKQRYDGKISCEYIPVNRGKASEAGAKI